jgi:transcription elongation factor Elf1
MAPTPSPVNCPICRHAQVACGVRCEGRLVFERECENCGVTFNDEGAVEELRDAETRRRIEDAESMHLVCADLR